MMEEKLKIILEKCMQKKMSLHTIFQVVNLSQLPIEIQILEKLIQKMPKLNEQQFRVEIGKIIEQATRN